MYKHGALTISLSTFCLNLFILAHCHVGLPVFQCWLSWKWWEVYCFKFLSPTFISTNLIFYLAFRLGTMMILFQDQFIIPWSGTSNYFMSSYIQNVMRLFQLQKKSFQICNVHTCVRLNRLYNDLWEFG